MTEAEGLGDTCVFLMFVVPGLCSEPEWGALIGQDVFHDVQ
jgi:hypothetical protein